MVAGTLTTDRTGIARETRRRRGEGVGQDARPSSSCAITPARCAPFPRSTRADGRAHRQDIPRSHGCLARQSR